MTLSYKPYAVTSSHTNQPIFIPLPYEQPEHTLKLYTPYKRSRYCNISTKKLPNLPININPPLKCADPYCSLSYGSFCHTGDTSWIEPPLLCGPLGFDRRGNRSPPLAPGTVRSLPPSNLSRLSGEDVEGATPVFTLGV